MKHTGEKNLFMYENEEIAWERKMLLLRIFSVLLSVAIALLLSVPLLARTTYVITDGNRVTVHTTAAAEPESILGEAGLELGVNDTYTTREGDGVSEIRIIREQTVRVDYYGKLLEVTTQGETVGELLNRLNLSWQEGDCLSKPVDARTYDGMELTVGRAVEENQTYTTVLPHETIHCSDGTLPEGTHRIVTKGEDGQVLCEATVTYLNGVETDRKVLSRQVVSQPVSEIIAVGTGVLEEEKTSGPVIGGGLITLPTGEVLTYTEKVTCLATAYTCEGYVGTTATGTRARVGAIAVDPEVFPYGTRFYIQTRDGEYIYGVATAEDCGDKRFIYDTRLDLYFDTKKECIQFGARSCDVYILG